MLRPLALVTTFVAVALVGCGDDPIATSKPAPATTPSSGTPYDNQGDKPAATPDTSGVVSEADNSAKNARDDGTTLTPIDQGLSEADTNITKAVREAVVAEPNLSVKAQNAKIITNDGVVTLRGPVATSIERTTIMTIAERTPGVKRVDNQLEVVSQ